MSAGLEDLFEDELPPPPEAPEDAAPEPVAAEEPTDETPAEPEVEEEAPSGDDPAPEEEPAATGEPAPPPEDYRKLYERMSKRYSDIRRSQMGALTAAQQRAEFAESQLQAMLAEQAKPQAQQDFTQIANELRAFATEQGWDEAQTQRFAQIVAQTAQASASQQAAPIQAQLQAQQEAQRQLYASQQTSAIEAQNDDTLAGFQAEHPDIPDDQQQAMVTFLADIGELEAGPDGRPIPTPDAQGLRLLSREALDAAYEAATNPAVADVLRAQPEWAYSEQGLALARRLASDAPVATTQRTTPAQVDAKLAAAQTLSGPSGTRPGAAPVRDEIAELLEPEPPKFFSR